MPELVSQCTAAPVPPPTPPGVPPIPPERTLPAVPPIIAPAAWEDFSLFRETALLYISEPQFNAALRMAGDYFFGMLIECYAEWPAWPESSTRMELRAATSDLRHLQGFLASIGQERILCSLSPEDVRLSRHASAAARALKRLADSIESKLAKEAQ